MLRPRIRRVTGGRRTSRTAAVTLTASLGVLLVAVNTGLARSVVTGRVTRHEWQVTDRVKAELVADFDLWSAHEPGAQAACVPLSGERSTLAATTTARAWHTIAAQLHDLAVQALDLKGWGARLATRAASYHSRAGRARLRSASRLIVRGADSVYLGLHDLGDAYAGLSAWNCDQSGAYLASGGEFAQGHVALNQGFARIALTGPQAH